ncbi:hypothetical protein ABZ671_18800 [Micromonospora sp. NPDC006766]|uniref:hypothetical protein n=1 Tax=Micromonospora sp. NPDC006766 TaxID=3154778 RepID=UPI0033E2B883
MATPILFGRCRRCRAGLDSCRRGCRPARGRRRPRRCGPCHGTALYPTEHDAINVAVSIAATTGAANLVHRCPSGRGFHLTSIRRSA